MRITRRIVVSLAIVAIALASLGAFFQVSRDGRAQEEAFARRARLLADGLEGVVLELVERGDRKGLDRLAEAVGDGGGVAGLAVYGPKGELISRSSRLQAAPSSPPDPVRQALRNGSPARGSAGLKDRSIQVDALPLTIHGEPLGALAVVHGPTPAPPRLGSAWRRAFLMALAQTALIVLVTILVLRFSIAGPIAQMALWMKQLRTGEPALRPAPPNVHLFSPLTREVETFSRQLARARAAVEEEARLRQAGEARWTPDRLAEHVRHRLQGRPLLVVSNREPYMHVRRGRSVECIVPAGGLVTALDPIMRASGGTWIAHGAGDADWQVVDRENRIRVPADDPLYTLRRVALTKEEEDGYYYGLANEGLWPLCHIAHTRPVFRPEDWAHYEKANQKFADAAAKEMEGLQEPCILIQDYHLALLPELLKQRRPDARIAIFWHIPWPNPEAFGVCPWRRELLQGMLGADLIGFHTQVHCNNFLDTVDRTLESRVDWERFEVRRSGHATAVHPYPISVAFPETFQDVAPDRASETDRETFLKEMGITGRYLGIGVDRMDYTKGVLERFRSIERFLEIHPTFRGELTFVQLGAPSRTHIKRYHDFLAEVESEAERINWKFQARDWKPIVFLKRHHSHREILPFYRHADFCMVTSLHDGMNLVAKEFVASRDDGAGVLILSRFTGASRELRDALIVNPYDIEEMAGAIDSALQMSREDQATRMARMRETVREHNIYRWAGNLIEALSQVRLDQVVARSE
ncbi:MAG TPA: trehalose-6-phosphate synthase [Candidatus Polarisedimenticolia bacterium]|jgi:trehalose 6-phosphate synthase|nr:trehalose-6-phosphate synthase [Candidatus Polarisedimenticolia bacterium]